MKTLQTLTEAQNNLRLKIRERAREADRRLFLHLQRLEMTHHFYHLVDKSHADYGKRYNFFRGGRGGMRSTTIAGALVDLALDDKLRVVAGRSFQTSVAESNKFEIEAQIDVKGLTQRFDIQKQYIESDNGSLFIFPGFERNPKAIKSMSSIDILWWDEADGARHKTLADLVPTIRKKGSRIIFSWNPCEADAPIERAIQQYENDRYGCVVRNTTYLDNPWISDEFVATAESVKGHDYEQYEHVYLGNFWASSEASVFGRRVKQYTFEVDDSYGLPLIGIDWGFSIDPTVVVECYVRGRILYVRRSAAKVRLELSDTAQWLIHHVPSILKYPSYADCSRPETISLVQKQIPLVKPCKKYAGSVEDGVSFMQGFDEIVIHPECQHDTASGMIGYSYKLNPAGDPTRDIDGNKSADYPDAVRYAVEKLIKPAPKWAAA